MVEQDGWQFIFLRNKYGRSVNASKEIKKKERKLTMFSSVSKLDQWRKFKMKTSVKGPSNVSKFCLFPYLY